MSSEEYLNPLGVESSPVDIVNLGTLAEEMVYRLPGCADMMIRKTLQRMFREFCLTTWALRAITRTPLLPGEKEYRIIIPSQTSVLRFVSVWQGRRLLRDMEYSAIPGMPPKLVLKHEPSDDVAESAVELKVDSVCVPIFGAEDVPCWFMDAYGSAIVSGALFALFSMAGRPWSDVQQARYEGIAWQNALNEASEKSIAGSQIGNAKLDVVDRRVKRI